MNQLDLLLLVNKFVYVQRRFIMKPRAAVADEAGKPPGIMDIDLEEPRDGESIRFVMVF